MPNDRSTEQFRKLFVGGLSYSTTEEILKSHFEKYGEIVDVVVMKVGGKNGKSRGFGFVTFKEPEMLDAAQADRPHILDERNVETKRAMPRDEANSAEAHMTTKKLFVGALKKEVVADDLKDYFNQFGNIEEAEVICWKETGDSRGFGFVTFDDYDVVDKILIKKPHYIDNKRCEVKKALSKEEARNLKAKERVDSQPRYEPMFRNDLMGMMGEVREAFSRRYDSYGYPELSSRFGDYPRQDYGGGAMRHGYSYRSQPYASNGGRRREY